MKFLDFDYEYGEWEDRNFESELDNYKDEWDIEWCQKNGIPIVQNGRS